MKPSWAPELCLWHEICPQLYHIYVPPWLWPHCVAGGLPVVLYRLPIDSDRGRVGERKMACLKRCFVTLAVGVTLLVGLTQCVIAPVAPAPSAYVVSPPVVVVRPYRAYRPYRPYYGWYPRAYRW
jgi:hypothetical protein